MPTRIRMGLVLGVIMLLNQSLAAQQAYLSKEQYRDKTLAMIIGSIGGALTGYEYLNHFDTPDGFYRPGATMSVPKMPLLGLPDDWFILMNGTLGGTTKDEYNYAPWIAGHGRINSDDDQHIDFFNQYLLNQYGLSITYEDIKREWMEKQVSDFGGGQGAIEVMRDKNLMAPQCGHRDHGNTGHWLPECYIEHEMMGAAFPGMPNKAAEFADKFSAMTGEGEAVDWGYYWATAHSIAFFETDVRDIAKKALGVMPANCRPRQMWDICVMLHQKYPHDWRAAVRELWADHWSAPFAVGYDGIMKLSDVNNGTGFLSLLYGENDYMETLKISSLAGGDGDCTASSVVGLMGIVKGMAGTPYEFIDRIYDHGNGVWINDIIHAFSIKKDFKIEWRYSELVDMYQQNAEMSIRAFGGTVTRDGYYIQRQDGMVPQIHLPNWDFESGTLDNWTTWKSGPSSIWCERQCNDNTKACFAGSGHYKATILTHEPTAEAKIYQTIHDLIPGASYGIEGRVNAGGRQARLFVDNYGGPYKYASIQHGVSPFPYMYIEVSLGDQTTSMDVGLHAPPTNSSSTWCSLDDVIITQIEHPSPVTRYEAEQAEVNASDINHNNQSSKGGYVGGMFHNDSYIAFDQVMADYTGEHIVRINYANDGPFSTQKVWVNDRFVGLIEHSDTGPWGEFSNNVTDAFVKLNAGMNQIKLETNSHLTEVDFIDVLSPYPDGHKPPDGSTLVDGGIYRIIARHSGLTLSLQNHDAVPGAKAVQDDFEYRHEQLFRVFRNKGLFHIAPLNATNLAIEILGAGMDNTNPVGLWNDWNGDTQRWAILETDHEHFKIINAASGLALDVTGVGMDPGTAVFQYEYLGGLNQQWRFEFVGMNIEDFPSDCSGQELGAAFMDECGRCAGGNTGIVPNECLVTAIESFDAAEPNLFPNPAREKVYLNQSQKWELFNTHGALIRTGSGREIDLTQVPPGVYSVKASESMLKLVVR